MTRSAADTHCKRRAGRTRLGEKGPGGRVKDPGQHGQPTRRGVAVAKGIVRRSGCVFGNEAHLGLDVYLRAKRAGHIAEGVSPFDQRLYRPTSTSPAIMMRGRSRISVTRWVRVPPGMNPSASST